MSSELALVGPAGADGEAQVAQAAGALADIGGSIVVAVDPCIGAAAGEVDADPAAAAVTRIVAADDFGDAVFVDNHIDSGAG